MKPKPAISFCLSSSNQRELAYNLRKKITPQGHLDSLLFITMMTDCY